MHDFGLKLSLIQEYLISWNDLNVRFWASLFHTEISNINEMTKMQDFDIKSLW